MGARRNTEVLTAGPVGLPPPAWQEDLWKKVHRADALSKQKGRCVYCREPLSVCRVTADHVIPISRGGRTTRENIGAACAPCNSAKGSMPVERFKRLLRSREAHPSLSVLLARFRFRLWTREALAEKRILQTVGLAHG